MFCLFRLFRRPTTRATLVGSVKGSPRITVRRRANLGVEVDVTPLVSLLIRQLASDFYDETEDVGNDLIDIAKADASAEHERGRGSDDSYPEHERDALVQTLIDRIGGAEHVLYGTQVTELSKLLLAAGQVAVLPSQKNRGAA